MINFSQDGKNIDVVSPGTIAGNFYLIGAALFGAALTTTNPGDDVVLRRVGVFTGVPKAASAAWAQGDILYWDNTAMNFTKTATNNTRVAVANTVQQLADASGDVILDGHAAG
jgi:predicted RecA/RadA family phage recombinase